jgi:hypothetical protein
VANSVASAAVAVAEIIGYTRAMPHPASGPLRETLTIAECRAIAREHHPEPPRAANPRYCLGCPAR